MLRIGLMVTTRLSTASGGQTFGDVAPYPNGIIELKVQASIVAGTGLVIAHMPEGIGLGVSGLDIPPPKFKV
jgi:hypothetical protein